MDIEILDLRIKQLVGECPCLLARVFFSDDNIELINKQLILDIFERSGKKYLLNNQRKDKYLVVMRFVWIEYSRKLDFNIKEQIKDLNDLVIKEISTNTLSNFEQKLGHLEDIYEPRQINLLPENTRHSQKTELPPLTSSFFD